MHALLVVLICSLPIITLAGQSFQGSRFYHKRHAERSARNHTSIRQTKTYQIADLHEGPNFFDGWAFFTGADPTHGNVNFLNQQDAQGQGLATVQGNTAIVKVDNTNAIPPGGNRNSVRINTVKTYSGGLFIADFAAVPTGCGVWPAWWSVGPGWPEAGEIDVVEGVNKLTNNQYTVHAGGTGGPCTIDKNVQTTSNVVNTECLSSAENNAGCAFIDPDPTSFGDGFNQAGGGVFAHLWDSTGVKIWRFGRNSIPPDITSRNPNPSSWPTPSAAWLTGSCNTASHFSDHTLVLDITLCGDWAGNTFSSGGCPGSCADFIADPANFNNAAWHINYIAVYQ